MSGSRNEHIEKRAYEIWEKHGRPHGSHQAHWEEAERELANGAHPGAHERANGNSSAPTPSVSPIVPPAGAPAAKERRKPARKK